MRCDYKYIREKYDKDEMDRSIIDDRYLLHHYDALGWTPLHWAIKRNDIKMTRLLLQSPFGEFPKNDIVKWKSDPNKGDAFNRIPLIIAVQNRNTNLIKLLLEFKSQPTLKTAAGFSSFSICHEKI